MMATSSTSSPMPSSSRAKVEADQQNPSNGTKTAGGEHRPENGIHSENMGAESDVDELVDSDTEKTDVAPKTKGTRGRAKNVANTSKKSSPTASNANTQNGNSSKSQPDKTEGSDTVENGNHRRVPSESSPMNTSPKRQSPALANREQVAQSSDARAAQSSSSSREMSGRTATGGPVPYYYNTPGAQNARSANSPRSATFKKTSQPTSGSKLQAGSSKNEASSDGEDLTPLEVDKFLELIEKHNLDTSSEDDMARSVTELYQEWLEWCAKRSVQTTKSKQALVGEFQRIHSGYYGTPRQKRAITIVQGSRTPMFGASFDPVDARNANSTTISSNEEASRQRGANRPVKLRDVAASISRAPNSALSNNVKGRSVSPLPPAAYDDPYARNGVPAAVVDSLHRQIRDEIWTELGSSLRQAIRDETADLRAEIAEQSNRIVELERHSDRLAEWVQHLKSVQEETEHALRITMMHGPPHPSAPPGAVAQPHLPPGPGRGPPREEMIRDGMHGGPPGDYRPYPDPRMGPSNGIDGPPGGRGYPPGYGPPANGPPILSPETRAYPMPRRSPSPAKSATHRSASRAGQHRMPPHEVYDRSIAPSPNHPDAIPHGGPPPAPNHLKHPGYPEPARVVSGPGSAGGPAQYYADEPMRNGPPPPPAQGGYMSDPRQPPPPGSRGFYPGHPMDERMHYASHPNSPSMSDPRMAKRARNGY